MQKSTLAILFVTLISCSKDSLTPTTSAIAQYVVFKPGSYWIYDIHIIDDDGEKRIVGLDSVYVAKDSLINGSSYGIIQGTRFKNSFKTIARDSGNFFVSLDHEILFSIDPYHVQTDSLIIGEMLFGVMKYSCLEPQTINTPAGTFDAARYQGKFYENGSYSGENLDANIYYSAGVGLVKHQASLFSSGKRLVRELKRYKAFQ